MAKSDGNTREKQNKPRRKKKKASPAKQNPQVNTGMDDEALEAEEKAVAVAEKEAKRAEKDIIDEETHEKYEKVKRGESLATPLGESGYFPPLLVQITSIGEQTGKLDELLLNAADTFDAEADSAISRFMAIFPALLILLLALVIGFIIAATLLPIVVMELGGGAL